MSIISPYDQLAAKYGNNVLYIKGIRDQPLYSYSFDLTYNNIKGKMKCSWENHDNDFQIANIAANRGSLADILMPWNTMLYDNSPVRIKSRDYRFSTELSLELPDNPIFLDLHKPSFYHRFGQLFKGTLVPSSTIDISPKQRLYSDQPIEPFRAQLVRLVKFLEDDNCYVTTDHEDAVTAKFYLHIKVDKRYPSINYAEKLFSLTYDLWMAVTAISKS